MICPSCCAFSVVGVPPPIYTVSNLKLHAFATSEVYSSSLHSKSTYCGISLPVFSVDCATKEQYAQRVGQNGMEIYKLNDSGLEAAKIGCSCCMVRTLNAVFS